MKHLGKIIVILFFGIILLGAPNTGSASISLEFNPMNQSVDLGNIASVDFVVTGADSTPIGAIDFWVNYDPSIVLFNSIVWGTLGAPTDFTDINTDDVSITGISAGWLPPSSSNPSTFTLLTMNFDTVGVGTSDLWLTDAFGDAANGLAIDGSGIVHDSFFFGDSDQANNIVLDDIQPGTITVNSSQVPEPGTAMLLGFGLIALASLKKRIS